MNATIVQNQSTPATPTLSTDNKEVAVVSTSSATTNPKGDFKTQSYRLKRSKLPRRFGCKMCEKFCNSIHELSIHHQQSHNILYCDTCNKAFNNPASLARHKYVHQETKFQCADCDQAFPFESPLKAHCISHRTLPSHF